MAHPDLDDLLDSSLKFAQQCLEKYGAFFPFGMSTEVNGKGRVTDAWNGEERPLSKDLIELLNRGYQQDVKNGEIRAACICSDVKITTPSGGKTDAIRCELEHVNGESVSVYLPYQKTGKVFEYGQLTAEMREPKFFVKSSSL